MKGEIMRLVYHPILMAVVCIVACQSPIDLQPTFEALVEAENAFCRMAAEHGVRDAFYSFLDDEAIVFRPKPILGRPIYAEADSIPGLLSWNPVFVDAAASQKFGYTTGPYEYKTDPEDEIPASRGHYVSLWRKGESGEWRNVIDVGCEYGQPFSYTGDIHFVSVKRSYPSENVDPEKEKEHLLLGDVKLEKLSRSIGLKAAMKKVASEDIRIYRQGNHPATGIDAGLDLVPDVSGAIEIIPMYAFVATSCDLGYTYGMGSHGLGLFSYLHIWKKESGEEWKIVLDLTVPIPE